MNYKITAYILGINRGEDRNSTEREDPHIQNITSKEGKAESRGQYQHNTKMLHCMNNQQEIIGP